MGQSEPGNSGLLFNSFIISTGCLSSVVSASVDHYVTIVKYSAAMFKTHTLKLLKRALDGRIDTSRVISTTRVGFSVETANVTKRDDYYKQLGSQNDDTRPAGWDEALPFEDVPGPRPLPLLGNIWRFLPYIGEYYNLPLQQFHNLLRKQYGDIVHLKGVIGRKSMLLVYNPDDMEVVLRNAGSFPIRKGMEAFIYYRTKERGDTFKNRGGVLTVQGTEWYKFRSVVNPILMQPRVAQQYVGSMDKVANELINNIKYFSKQDKNNEMAGNFQNELYKWALESVGVIVLDKNLGCLNLNAEGGSESQKFITHVVQMLELMYKLEILPPFWKLYSTPSWKKFVNSLNFITDTTLKHIEEALSKTVDENKPEEDMSVLQRLAKVDKDVAIAMAMDALIAGIDTTGKSMAAALYLMAKNPDKQQRLREEALKYLPEKNSPVTKEILSKSSYLKAAVKETIRIAPIAIGNLRTCVKDLVLSGYKIPKDTEVVTLNLLSSNSDEFKDPERFIPERWLRDTQDEYSHKNAHPFAYLPFGFGARSCVGQRLATLELEVALLKIIRNFELSWPHEDMVFSAKFLYGIQSPLKLRVVPFDK